MAAGARGSQPAPEPGSGSSGTQGSTFHAELALPQGSYQQFPGAPVHTLISAGLHIMGLGCPRCCFAPQEPLQLSSTPAVDKSIPWDTHSGMSVMSKSWLSRKMLQPGKTGNSHHKESLLKSNPSPSGKWGVFRPRTSPLEQFRDAPMHSWSSKTPALYSCHTGLAPGLTKGKVKKEKE